MKEISHFCNIKEGDCFLFEPILSEKNEKDERKTIIIVNNGGSDIHFFDVKGELSHSKLVWATNKLSQLADFHFPSWKLFKLNKKEKLMYKKELILGSL